MAAQTSSVSQPRINFSNILFREIHKNAWLKKINNAAVKKKKDKLWVVFCVHDDTDAFLETYIDNKIAVLHKPEWFVHLNEIQHISPTICPSEQEYEFVLTLKTEVIKLTAPTWDQMLDWVASLQAKLHELRILDPKDNVYTKLPEGRTGASLPLFSTRTRDPNSPLPLPPPPSASSVRQGLENLHLEPARSSSAPPIRNLNRSVSENANPPESVFNFEHSSLLSSENAASTNGHYEHLFNVESGPVPGPSSRQAEQATSLQEPPVPTPYKTFREQQVLQLQREMQHSAGVRLQLRKKDCISSIALVDVQNAVWVCGWKQREHPMLYNALHIGDRLVSVAGMAVKSAAEAYRILESHYCGLYVDFLIKRLPFGRIHLFHRESEGQPLGIVQENNTAVVESVESGSLAAKQGMPSMAPTCDGLSLTNWVITEVNGRPLNLFYKKNQVKDRLNSVGRDISILIQPFDLVKQLKKELKSFRNYKEYLLQ